MYDICTYQTDNINDTIVLIRQVIDMGNQIADYSFTIIEDGQVPLAGNFDTFNYSPVIAAVVMSLVLLAVIAYTFWFIAHSERIRVATADSKAVFAKYYFHPISLLRDIRDFDYSLVNVTARS